MAIEILKTTVVRQASETTANARYAIDYTIVESELQQVKAEVYDTRTVEVPLVEGEGTEQREQEVLIGTLAMDGGVMRNTNFPFCEKYALYVSDFVGIVNQILSPQTT